MSPTFAPSPCRVPHVWATRASWHLCPGAARSVSGWCVADLGQGGLTSLSGLLTSDSFRGDVTEVPQLGNSPMAVACPLEPKPPPAFGASSLPGLPGRRCGFLRNFPTGAVFRGGPAPHTRVRRTPIPPAFVTSAVSVVRGRRACQHPRLPDAGPGASVRCGGHRGCFSQGLPGPRCESWEVSAGLLLQRRIPSAVG